MERCTALLTIRLVLRAALAGDFLSVIPRRTMRGLNLIASYCGQTSHFPLRVKFRWIIFIAKLTAYRCFAIHDRRSMWSACHPSLFRPGLLLRPSTPLNNPPTLLLLSTALSHIHLFLVRLPFSFFSHSQFLSQLFLLLSRHALRKRWQRRHGRGLVRAC